MTNQSSFQTLCEELKALYLNPDTRRRHPAPVIRLAEKIVKKFKKKYSLEKLDLYLDLELT